jgi:Ca-activated chloride channel family protein
VSVTGRRAGREERFSTTAAFAAEQPANDYVAPLWAARKAGALAREIRLRGMNREILEELKRLALRWGILTEYTAYLVQEPGVIAQRDMEERMLRQSAAPAPEAAVGAASVGRARRDAAFSGAVQLSEIVVTGAALADSISADAVRARSGINPRQRVGGRLFIQRHQRWVDLRHVDSAHTVRVEAYSLAYVALLRALPELREPAGLGETVVVAGQRVSIEIGTGGVTVWRPGELERLVREFRG